MGNNTLIGLLQSDNVLCHPFVIAEIACGTPPEPRKQTLYDLSLLKPIKTASHDEVLAFIEEHKLYGKGCGFIDFALLASVVLDRGTRLWTNDKKLRKLAKSFDVMFDQ